MQCEYCKNLFTSLGSLNAHRKSAKYCTVLQIHKKPNQFICVYCDKEFTQQVSLNYHLNICKEQKKEYYDEKDNENKQIIDNLKLENKNIIEKYEEIINNLKLENKNNAEIINKLKIENKCISDINTILLNQKKINKTPIPQNKPKLEKLGILTYKHMEEQVKNLTIEHVENGVDGYVDFAIKNIFNDKIICTDYSRKIVKYKIDKDSVITDSGMKTLTQLFFKSIYNRCIELKNEIFDKIKKKYEHIDFNIELDLDINQDKIHIKIAKKIKQDMDMVQKSSKGIKTKLSTRFIDIICSKMSCRMFNGDLFENDLHILDDNKNFI